MKKSRRSGLWQWPVHAPIQTTDLNLVRLDKPRTALRLSGVQQRRHFDFPEFCKVCAVQIAAIMHPLLTLLASLTRQELAQQMTYLKQENKILRSMFTHRIQLNNQERRRLVKHGLKLGTRIKDLISVASYSTFRRWVRAMEDGPENRPANKCGNKGRPSVDEDKHEVLNGFCVINERHFEHLLKVGADWYSNRCGHSGRDHLPPIRDNDAPPTDDLTKHKQICVEELVGHLKSYRAAA